MLSLKMTTYLVRDYDEAIDYFVNTIGFELLEDMKLSTDKRWVRVGLGASQFLLAMAVTPEQIAAIGHQSGGRVGFFIESDDFDVDFARLRDAGVNFPRKCDVKPMAALWFSVIFMAINGICSKKSS